MQLEPITLDSLSVGSCCVVTSIEGDDQLTRRLLEMGLFEGEELEVVAKAPLGDPLEVRLSQSSLSLRVNEARRIIVIEAGNKK
jgi:ferrous iron transport protein A